MGDGPSSRLAGMRRGDDHEGFFKPGWLRSGNLDSRDHLSPLYIF